MGRSRTKKQVVKRSVEPAVQNTPSVPALVEKAQSLIVQCDYELAERFVHRILEQEPSNVIAKEMLGVVQLETGELELAKLVPLYTSIHPKAQLKFIRPDVHIITLWTLASTTFGPPLSCTTKR